MKLSIKMSPYMEGEEEVAFFPVFENIVQMTEIKNIVINLFPGREYLERNSSSRSRTAVR